MNIYIHGLKAYVNFCCQTLPLLFSMLNVVNCCATAAFFYLKDECNDTDEYSLFDA